MFARGVVSLCTTHLPVPKILAPKSRVSTTSKLIETKAVQVLHSGHLRKTGGWGLSVPINPANLIPTASTVFSCPGTGNGRRFRHQSRVTNHQSALSIARSLRPACFTGTEGPALSLAEGFARARRSIHPPRLRAPNRFPSKSFVSPTYKFSARNSFISPTYAKTGGCTSTQKCRRADIFDFSPDIPHFFILHGFTTQPRRGREELAP